MAPSYIKDILGGTIDKPIVVIWDGQKPEVIETLRRRDPEIGPALSIVAEDIVPNDIEIPEPLSDFIFFCHERCIHRCTTEFLCRQHWSCLSGGLLGGSGSSDQ